MHIITGQTAVNIYTRTYIDSAGQYNKANSKSPYGCKMPSRCQQENAHSKSRFQQQSAIEITKASKP